MSFPIIVYHKIDTSGDFGVSSVQPKNFESHIHFLNAHRYDVSGISNSLNSGGSRPVGLVFDDAYENVFRHAFPVLQKFQVTATVAVIADYVGKWNDWDIHFGRRFSHATWDQLRIFSDCGWEIASHSCSHRSLTLLNGHELQREVIDSKKKIEDALGVSVSHFVYPFGKYNAKVVDTVQKAGYQSASGFFSDHRSISKFSLPRCPVYEFDTLENLKGKIAGSRGEKSKARVINLCSNATILTKKISELYLKKPYIE